MTRPLRRHGALAAAALALAAGTALGACSDGSDPESTGPETQAIERLNELGLNDDVAECIVDELGADAVVEAGDLNAFTESQQYRDAAKACADG